MLVGSIGLFLFGYGWLVLLATKKHKKHKAFFLQGDHGEHGDYFFKTFMNSMFSL
jgi:hypothetical protein